MKRPTGPHSPRQLRALAIYFLVVGCAALLLGGVAFIIDPVRTMRTSPLLAALVGLFLLLARSQWNKYRPLHRSQEHCCIHCGYDLKLNVSGICPECGAKAG